MFCLFCGLGREGVKTVIKQGPAKCLKVPLKNKKGLYERKYFTSNYVCESLCMLFRSTHVAHK